MRVFLDCFPCFLKQALECAKFSTDDAGLQKEVLNRVMNILISLDYTDTPPHIAREVYKEIKRITKNEDPYHEIRVRDNKQMMEVYDNIRCRILEGKNAIYLACKLAAGGNIIDSGAGKRKDNHTKEDVEEILNIEPAIDDFAGLKNEMNGASTILYLGDNSGEIVLDKLFIEIIKKENPDIKIYYGVRGEPVINDIIEEDAMEVDIGKFCDVISNGDSSPGTNLSYCSDEFREVFNNADLIISKGQGNYETLSDVKNKNIYFLLIAKCPVIARHIGIEVGSMVIKAGG